MKVAVITASDRCARGEAIDESGPALVTICEAQGWTIVYQQILPDDRDALALAIADAVDRLGADLVLTTGGTGLSPRDVTPEATAAVVDRMTPGIAEALRSESLKKTPYAMLSRGVSGMRGRSLVVNLPGSPRGARECLEILIPVLPHAIDVASGARH